MRNVHAPAREKPLGARLSSAKTWRGCGTCGWAVTVIANTQLATLQVSQVGSSPGGSWQWLLLHVVFWIMCVESQVKTPINKSAGGEGIGYEVRRPDGLAHRTVLTRILQAPPALRHGAQAGGWAERHADRRNPNAARYSSPLPSEQRHSRSAGAACGAQVPSAYLP